MRKRITYYLFLFLFCSINIFGQNKINNYEYWFDNNYAGKASIDVAPITTLDLNTTIPTTGINNGLHVLHLRFKDDSSRYSSTLSQFFQKLPVSSSITRQIVAYEYWFDNNYAGKTTLAATPQATTYLLTSALSASTLNTGLHILHIRFKDDGGGWSSVVSQFFQKLPSSTSTSKQVVAYEYWFDNSYTNKTFVPVTPQAGFQLLGNLDASALQTGLHVIHIRFKDDGGGWSSVLSQFIQKVSGAASISNEINAYEYWFDNNYAGKVLQTVSTQSELQLLTSIDAQSLNDGLHVFHVRFRDIGNSWSSVLSQFIQKIPATTSSSNEINAYEYWFDNNYAGKVLQTVSAQSQLQLLTSINSSSINDGLHVFHIRFKDIGNSWSSVSSNFFQKFGQSASVKNSITLYRYWFDTADSIMYNVKLASPINLYLLNTPLDLSKIYKGDHIIHFQFLDSLKKWSSVTSDSMYKFPIVDAMYTMSDSIICDSGTVHFTNKSSIDADKYKWVFDDGTTSTLINPSHHYNSYGTHPIKLIAIDTTKSVTDSLTLSIFVVHSPAIHLGSDTAVCPTGITLDATNPSSTYLWSNSLTTSSIHVNSQGNYSVLVTNQYGCIARDTIHININPIPNVHLGNDTAVCPTGITLVATNPSSTYLWSNSLTTSSIHVNSQGNYSVKVTNQYGCIARDTIHININPVPNVHLGNDTAVCPTGITLDATYPNSTYLWSNSLTTSSIHVNSQGNYSVKVTNQYGCFARDTIHVNINPAPVVNLGKDTTICTYNSIVLDAGSGFSYYAWNTGQSTEKITVNTTGYYAVEVLNSYGCSGIDTIHVLTDPCTGIKDISENGFVLVYPNPNSGNYFIKALSDFNEPAEMEITDLTGRLLLHKENIFLIKDEVIPIDNESYNDGTYLLYITSKSTRFIQKIVINH